MADTNGDVDFGEGKKNVFVALEGARVLLQNETELPFAVRNGCEVQMAVKEFGKGRGVYISGLPYSFKNSRVLYRAMLWAASAEADLHKLVFHKLQCGSPCLCKERQILRGQQHL